MPCQRQACLRTVFNIAFKTYHVEEMSEAFVDETISITQDNDSKHQGSRCSAFPFIQIFRRVLLVPYTVSVS